MMSCNSHFGFRSVATNIKRVSVELGGKAANIILPDADIREAVDGGLFGDFLQ